jgi:transposase
MTSLSDLREVVDVVIGVDTHVHTHSSAAIDAAPGGVLGEIAVDGTAEGYAQLVELAGEQATLKVWGNRRHRRPWSRPRPTPGQATGDRGRARPTQTSQAAQLREVQPLDAIRAAREALHGPGSGPRAAVLNAKHSRCCWQPVAPRSRPPPSPSSRRSAW